MIAKASRDLEVAPREAFLREAAALHERDRGVIFRLNVRLDAVQTQRTAVGPARLRGAKISAKSRRRPADIRPRPEAGAKA